MLNKKIIKYPNLYKRTCFIKDLFNLAVEQTFKVSVFGRVTSYRVFGKAMFVDMVDVSGKIQIYISTKTTTEETFKKANKLRLGMILWCRGILFLTKKDKKVLKVFFFDIVVKPVLQFPTTWFGLRDTHKRYTHRYLDFFLNEDSKKIIMTRVLIISSIRKFLLKFKYLEVETPILHTKSGGAIAKPFTTSSNNILKKKLYLRIAPELYLKRLLVAGFERVFEIGKNFRNEGISYKHNFEFTTIEFYEAYANYKDYMFFVEKLLKVVFKSVLTLCDKKTLSVHNTSFFNRFKRISYEYSLIFFTNTFFTRTTINNKERIINFLDKYNITYVKSSTVEELKNIIFEKFVVEKLRQPTFIYNTPAKFAPLARCCENNSNIAERFELYISGIEIADGFSELNDVITQELNFKKQATYKQSKDNLDNSFLTALKYGLPPAAGVGIGIDRLVMVCTEAITINDVFFFPTVT